MQEARYLIADEIANRPPPFLTHPIGYGDGCDSTRLRHDNVAMPLLLGIFIHDVLRNLSGFSAPGCTLDDHNLISSNHADYLTKHLNSVNATISHRHWVTNYIKINNNWKDLVSITGNGQVRIVHMLCVKFIKKFNCFLRFEAMDVAHCTGAAHFFDAQKALSSHAFGCCEGCTL